MTGRVGKVARAGLERAAKGFDRVRPPRSGTVVLIYHRVGATTPTAVDVPLDSFRDQVDLVAERACRVDDLLDGTATSGADDRNPVVVTFDDGTVDVIDSALPVLAERKVPMLLYIATDFIERQREFRNEGRPVSWQALADGLESGYLEVGSHTHTHALLDRIDAGAVDDELDRSIGLIEDRLGVTPRHFAYPKGVIGNAAAQAAVKHRFASAAVCGMRTNPPGGTDPWSVTRTPVQASDALDRFEAKLAGGLRLEDDVRTVVNKVRYRKMTT